MIRRLNHFVIVAVAAALALTLALPGGGIEAQAQSGRFLVLIPDLFPAEDTGDGFGKDTAEKLREALAQLAAYEPIEKDDIEDKLDDFDLDMDELACLETRQLGGQMNAQVALCADYEEIGDDQVRVYNVSFWDLQNAQSFELEEFTIHKDDDEGAAAHIMAEFDAYVEAASQRTYCFQYAEERAYEDALRNCNLALEANPEDAAVMRQTARVYLNQAEQGENEYDLDVLAEGYPFAVEAVEVDPFNPDGLQLAGFMATQLGENSEGREFYNQYLEQNPGDIGVRRNIAYEMYQAGDPRGAMQFIQEGIDVEPSADLLVDYGNYAFATARAEARVAQAQDSEGITPEVAELYREAIDAYGRAFEEKGAEMSVASLRNVVNAHLQLDQYDQASDFAERVIDAHPEDPGIWRAYATALQRQGQLDEALDAMAQLGELDPDAPNLYALQGQWLLEDGQLDRAAEMFRRAVERGQDPNVMARRIFADGHQAGNSDNDYDKAIRYINSAKEFDVSPSQMQEFNFWHGWFLFRQAQAIQEPQTLQSAQASLPKFQQARELIASAQGYGDDRPGINITEYLGNIDTFIEIQEAIIRRGG